MKIKKFTGLVFLLICILSFSACDGSVRGSRPQSLSVGNDWNSMKALGAVSFSGTGRARSISSGGALDDSAVFIAVKDDGTIEDMVLLDENGNNVLENKIVSYYKQRSRFDFINVQSSDNPNYWPFDDWVHSPDDDDAILFVVDKGTGKIYLLNGVTSQKWFTDGYETYEYENTFLSSIQSWETNSVPIGFHKFTFNGDGTLTVNTYWTRDVIGCVWLDRFGNIFYEHYTEDKNGGYNLHGTSYSLTGVKIITPDGSTDVFEFADGYEIEIGFNGISYLFRKGEPVMSFADGGQLTAADYVPDSFKDLYLDRQSVKKGKFEFYIEPDDQQIIRVSFRDADRIEYDCSSVYYPKDAVYGITEDHLYYFHNGQVTVKSFDGNDEKSFSLTAENGKQVRVTMFTEGTSGNMNFQGRAGSESVAGYIMPQGGYRFTGKALDFDTAIISPVN